MKDTHLRSIIKTITWRAIATLTTTIAAYIFTGSAKTALSIGGLELTAKLFLYYAHERIWTHITWGRPHLDEH